MQKIYPKIICIVFLIGLLLLSTAYAEKREDIRKKSLEYAKPLEVVMVDGPFFVEDNSYYVVDYVRPDSTIDASLVYDSSSNNFISESEIIRKVLATKDLKKLTFAEPLFYAVGEPYLIIQASQYETQNVRNFASFSSITPEERNILEIFLRDYENVMVRVANVSRLTQEILYPDNRLSLSYITSPPSIDINVEESGPIGHFSYEGFEDLIGAYEELNHDYRRLSSDLSAFTGGLPEFPPGAIIREKWEVQITKEGILEEVAIIERNGVQIQTAIDLRTDILTYDYFSAVTDARGRLGEEPSDSGNLFSSLSVLLSKMKKSILMLLGLVAMITLTRGKRPPGKNLINSLSIGLILTLIISAPLSIADPFVEIQSMEDIISQKVGPTDKIPYNNLASDINDTVIEDMLIGFRLILKGEKVDVKGPFNHFGKPYYFFDIKNNGISTGNGFLVDAEKFRLVGDQRQAYQLLKTLLFSNLLKEDSLYLGVDAQFIQEKGKETIQSPLDLFLMNLSRNIIEGNELESLIIDEPDFETLMNLTNHYVEAFILIQNIGQLVSEKETHELTGGFSDKRYKLDAYSRATRGLSSQEFLQGRKAQYRGRTLNRLPLITQLSGMGLRPSKAQVAHDLASDLVHDNTYLWQQTSVSSPNLFARLSFREGTYTLPQSALNQ